MRVAGISRCRGTRAHLLINASNSSWSISPLSSMSYSAKYFLYLSMSTRLSAFSAQNSRNDRSLADKVTLVLNPTVENHVTNSGKEIEPFLSLSATAKAWRSRFCGSSSKESIPVQWSRHLPNWSIFKFFSSAATCSRNRSAACKQVSKGTWLALAIHAIFADCCGRGWWWPGLSVVCGRCGRATTSAASVDSAPGTSGSVSDFSRCFDRTRPGAVVARAGCRECVRLLFSGKGPETQNRRMGFVPQCRPGSDCDSFRPRVPWRETALLSYGSFISFAKSRI
mmetsp:Transcript_21945/g.51475  ORF Transcript_21945/g.51475 Transcript_21945/m.51475 type:complete len:282 (+) Transcript_21945:337-1182(+)